MHLFRGPQGQQGSCLASELLLERFCFLAAGLLAGAEDGSARAVSAEFGVPPPDDGRAGKSVKLLWGATLDTNKILFFAQNRRLCWLCLCEYGSKKVHSYHHSFMSK
jgi:hypothetical protein